jgi:mono/diheme cytochrome c family protein
MSPAGRAAAALLGVVLACGVAGPAAAAEFEGSGAALYRRYCAACHGLAGRGDGPAASALAPAPTDLTRLTSDTHELMRQIDGRQLIDAHGTAQMPVWGEVFEQSLLAAPNRRLDALRKVEALADYVYRLRAGADERAR